MAKKSIVERISDTVREIVDTASTAAANAMKPDPQAVAGVTNEQVYIPEATDAAAVPPPIITRKKKDVPAPLRANKRVAAARTKKTPSAAKKSSKKAVKAPPKKAAKKAAPKKAAKKSAPKKTAKKSKSKSRR